MMISLSFGSRAFSCCTFLRWLVAIAALQAGVLTGLSQAPTITAPAGVQALPGGSATFSVTASGTGPFAYQWYRDGVRISSATASSLTLTNLSVADVVSYTVRVSNAFGAVTSSPASISGPDPAPTIAVQPASQIGIVGNPVTLSVSATSAGALTYQWRRNGYAMPGATNATLTIPDPRRLDAGLYDVVVARGLSRTMSVGARLSVAPSSYANTLQVDATFAPRFEAAGGVVNAILTAPAGKFIVTGDFTRLNGVECPGIARVDENLQVDLTFTPPTFFSDQADSFPAIGITRVHAVLDDGRLLVTHALPVVGDYPFRNRLVRLLANGSVDPTFSVSTEPETIVRLAMQPDGRLIVIGLSTATPLPAGKRYVYRLNSDGSLDPSYAPVFTSASSDSPPTVVAVQPDGRAIFGGGFNAVNGASTSGLVRLTSTGALDSSFAVQGVSNPLPHVIEVLSDGRLLVGGMFSIPNATSANLVRLSANGALEAILLQESGGAVRRLGRQADGKIWAVGGNPDITHQLGTIWRLSAAGVTEQKTTASMYGLDWPVVPAGADRALLAAKPDDGTAIVRLGIDGTADGTTASVERNVGVNVVIPAPGGKIYAAGPFTRVNGISHKWLVRLTPNGGRDPTFDVGSGFDAPPDHLLLLGDRQLMASGQFSTYRGSSVRKIVRLQSNGDHDTSFTPELLNGFQIYGSMTQLLSGQIVVGGAVFRADGSIDPAWQTGNSVPEIALPDGGLLFGSGSTNSYSVGRLRADGTPSDSAHVSVYHLAGIALQPDDKILAGGAGIDSVVQPTKVVRLRANVTSDSFSITGLPLPAFTSSAYRGPQLLVQEDGRFVLNDYHRFSRLHANGAFDSSFVLNGVSVVQEPAQARSARGMLFLDDGNVLIADRALTVHGLRRQGVVRLVDRASAVIVVQPAAQSTTQGGAVTLRVGVTSPDAPLYQWLKDGQPVAGATAGTLLLGNISGASGGSYSVNVTNANGTVRSGAALVTVQPPGAPVIAAHPKPRYVSAGQSASLSVVASGAAPLTYRWLKDGAVIFGATQDSYTIASATATDAGHYSVEVTNLAGSVVSNSAALGILPAGIAATHDRIGPPPSPGGTVTIANSVSYTSAGAGLKWQVLLPSGWSIASSGSTGGVAATPGTTGLAEWSWTTPPSTSMTFSYVLNVPSTLTGVHELTALVSVPSSNGTVQLLATPEPLLLGQQHSADSDADFRISLLELTRVIELYNTSNGGTRTGCYTTAASLTEDGFAPDSTRLAGGNVTLARYHSADSDRDGMIAAGELARVIDLFNYRSGTVRTGQYRVQGGTVDGFAPGP